MSVKRLIATLISDLVLGFIIFNFENWLEWKGFNTVFIDAERSMSEMDWSLWHQVNAFMVSDFMTGFALAALIFGFWDWIARRFTMIAVRISDAAKVRQWSAKSSVLIPLARKPQDQEREVIPVTLRVWGTMTGDGVNIEPQIIYRNRSLFNLKIKATEAAYFLGDKAPAGSPSRGFSGDLKKESNGEVSFNAIRIHDTTKTPSGTVSIAFLYGENEERMKTKIRITYQFEIMSMPEKERARQKLKTDARQYCVYEDI